MAQSYVHKTPDAVNKSESTCSKPSDASDAVDVVANTGDIQEAYIAQKGR